MMAITIGDLRHRLTLEAATRTGDGGGGAETAWTALAEIWGSVRTRTGSERLEADGNKGRITHEVTIRWREDVTPAMRIREGERILDIKAAFDSDDRRQWLKCLCEERAP